MTASIDFFSGLILSALVITTAAPVILVAMFVRDHRRGTLW